MNIRTKLLGGFAIVLLITAGLGYYAVSQMGSIAQQTQALYEKHTLGSQYILQANSDMIASGRAEKNAILANDPAEIAKHSESAMKLLKSAEDNFAQYSGTIELAATREKAAALPKYLTEIGQGRQKVLDLAKENKEAEAVKAAAEVRATVDKADALMDELVTSKKQLGKQAADDATQSYNSARTTSIILIAVALAIGAGTGFWLSRSISNGIGKMKQAAEGIAAGDLVQNVDVKSNDEIGDMAQTFQRMIAFLSTTMGEVRGAAAALDQQRRELASLASDASQATDAVASGSDQVSRASTEVARSITQVAEGASEQASSVQEVNRSIEQLSAAATQVATGAQQQAREVEAIAGVSDAVARAAQEMANQAQQAAEGARTNAQSAEEGAAAVEKTTTGIHSIQQALEAASAEVATLGSRSAEIGNIVSVIQDIAAQTNLLALNAAIEAARAGDQGRGFAVVADEVRQLAERVANATKEIGVLITGVQNGVASTVRAMEQGTTEMAAGTSAAGEASESLKLILGASREVAAQIAQISQTATQVQEQGQEMARRIAGVRDIVEQNSAAAEEMQATASSVGDSITAVAAIAEENSAATEEVSAATEQVSASAEEMTASAGMLRGQMEQVTSAAGELGRMSAQLSEQVAAFKLADDGAAPQTTRNGAAPTSVADYRRRAA